MKSGTLPRIFPVMFLWRSFPQTTGFSSDLAIYTSRRRIQGFASSLITYEKERLIQGRAGNNYIMYFAILILIRCIPRNPDPQPKIKRSTCFHLNPNCLRMNQGCFQRLVLLAFDHQLKAQLGRADGRLLPGHTGKMMVRSDGLCPIGFLVTFQGRTVELREGYLVSHVYICLSVISLDMTGLGSAAIDFF